MFGGVMFCEVISLVALARISVDVELSLSYTVAYPIKAHVHCFQLFLFDGVSSNALGSAVVGYHGGRWLRVPHLLQ